MSLPDKKYKGLKNALRSQKNLPGPYMFKFIIPSDNKLMAQIESLFKAESKIYRKESKNGKYLSITAVEIMFNAEQIISIYKKAEKIPDIIVL